MPAAGAAADAGGGGSCRCRRLGQLPMPAAWSGLQQRRRAFSGQLRMLMRRWNVSSSLEGCTINAFLGYPQLAGPGMIEIEDLSFREWECFEHLASQRDFAGKKTAFLCLSRLGKVGAFAALRWSRPKTSILFLMSQTFMTLAGGNPHFICYQLVTRRSSQIMEMIEADLVANGRNYCTARKCLRKHFQR